MSTRILVVDDEANIVNILRSNLEREGYKVLVAYDGEEAIRIALSRNPDLILLDCMLPGADWDWSLARTTISQSPSVFERS